MSWNYRALRKRIESPDGGNFEFAIHEVHHDENGNATSYTENPVFPLGNTQEELRVDLARYVEALTEYSTRPVSFLFTVV